MVKYPEDWKVVKLGDLCSITTGHKDVNDGCEMGQYPFFTCSKTVYAADSYSFDGEAITVAGNGDVGNLHYVNGKFEAYQRTYVLMNFKESVEYIWQYLDAKLMTTLSEGKYGSSMPYIVLGQLTGVSIPLPPLFEQKRIAAVLGNVDKLIDNLSRQLEKKRLVKQGVMQDLLTGKKRLPGFRGEWVEKRLGEICVINPPGGIIPEWFVYVDLESVGRGRLLSKNIVNRAFAPSRAQRCVDKNDILFQTVRPYQKNNLYVDFDANNWIASTGYAVLREIAGKSFSQFLYHVIHTDGFVGEVLERCTGTSYPAINPKKLAEIYVKLPEDIAEQKAIAKVLGDMDAEIARLEAKCEKYRQLKQGLMNDLLTGKVRI